MEKANVNVYQVCECDAVAAYSLDEAVQFYQNLTGLEDDELIERDLIEVVPLEKKVRKSEDSNELVTVKEILDMHWNGKPFIALSTGGY